MRVSSRVRSRDGEASALVQLSHAGGKAEVFIRTNDAPPPETEDYLVPLSLQLAMSAREALSIDGAVCPVLAGNIDVLQERVHAFDSILEKVPVAIREQRSFEPKGERQVGCFFSGGIDSFYSVLKHRDELDALIFIKGYDIPLSRDDAFAVVLPRIEQAASDLGLPLVILETNLKELADKFVSWPLHYHGAALGVIANFLQGRFRRLYSGGPYSYASLFAVGSHPMLDPLWSSAAVELIHDGCEATRSDKAAFIASSDIAMRSLRVCAQNRPGKYNCGACAKCLTSMTILEACGALASCTTFETGLDLRLLSRPMLADPITRWRVEQILDALAAEGGNPQMESALLSALLQWTRDKYQERSGSYTALALGAPRSRSKARGLRRLTRFFQRAGRDRAATEGAVTIVAEYGDLRLAGGVLRIRTVPKAWHFAARLQLPEQIVPGREPKVFLRFRVRVQGEPAAIGILNKAGDDFLSREEVRPSPGMRYVYLQAPDLHNCGDVIVQSWNKDAASVVEIESMAIQIVESEDTHAS